ncbi:unnamed protein product, partial [Brachionus calyciflorus]
MKYAEELKTMIKNQRFLQKKNNAYLIEEWRGLQYVLKEHIVFSKYPNTSNENIRKLIIITNKLTNEVEENHKKRKEYKKLDRSLKNNKVELQDNNQICSELMDNMFK